MKVLEFCKQSFVIAWITISSFKCDYFYIRLMWFIPKKFTSEFLQDDIFRVTATDSSFLFSKWFLNTGLFPFQLCFCRLSLHVGTVLCVSGVQSLRTQEDTSKRAQARERGRLAPEARPSVRKNLQCLQRNWFMALGRSTQDCSLTCKVSYNNTRVCCKVTCW